MNTNHDKPKLQFSRDYNLFETHEHNRRQHEDAVLLASMKKFGFMPSSPVQCVRTDGGKLKIIRGHHRFDCAKRLGIGLWYVVDSSNTDLFSLEAGRQAWSVDDFTFARAAAGNEDCAMVLDFQARHKLPLGAAASLIGGESAGSSNKIRQIKDGTFKAAKDQSHALAVVAITDRCRELGVPWATSSCFVGAVSAALRVPEFQPAVFLHRLGLYVGLMKRRTTQDGCLEEIETIYNHGAKDRRMPLVFRAKEIGKERHRTFGKSTNV